jgi:hypothetical protein
MQPWHILAELYELETELESIEDAAESSAFGAA